MLRKSSAKVEKASNKLWLHPGAGYYAKEVEK
jgi:hypothetical protein